MKEEIERRQYYNKLILESLSYLVDKYPDMRFGQLLWSTKILEQSGNEIKDPFYEESKATWNRMEIFR
jgi:hypothetical protein